MNTFPVDCSALPSRQRAAQVRGFLAQVPERPKPHGQCTAAYWQACRAYYVNLGQDKTVAGELAWADLEKVRVSRNKVYEAEGQASACLACGAPLDAQRSTRAFCSDAHRKRYARAVQMSA